MPAASMPGNVTLLVVGNRLLPRVPWALVVVVGGIAAAPLLSGLGLEVVGALPAGLPTLGLPGLQAGDLGTVALGGAAVALVGIGEGLTAARVFAAGSRESIDSDQSSTAQPNGCPENRSSNSPSGRPAQIGIRPGRSWCQARKTR